MKKKQSLGGAFVLLLTMFTVVSSCSDDGTAIDPDFVVDFEIEVTDDIAPATIGITNTSAKATTFNWSFAGGTPSASTDEDPGSITYENHGEFTVSLEASNGAETKFVIKSFKLYETDEIVTFEDISLGSIHLESTVGVAFSTELGRVVKSGEYNTSNGPRIDLLYFGSTEHSLFTFISPTSAETVEMTPVPGARTSIFVYETNTSSEYYFTAEQFDDMVDDRPIRELIIADPVGSLTPGVTGETDLPRVFVFRNAAGKNGIVKVTEITKGADGNIVFDLKIQK